MADSSSFKKNDPSAKKTEDGGDVKLPDPMELSRVMTRIAQQSQNLVTEFLTKQATAATFGVADPLNLGQAFFDMTARMIANPAKLVEAQLNLWSDYLTLWQSTTSKMLGGQAEPVAKPAPEDR